MLALTPFNQFIIDNQHRLNPRSGFLGIEVDKVIHGQMNCEFLKSDDSDIDFFLEKMNLLKHIEISTLFGSSPFTLCPQCGEKVTVSPKSNQTAPAVITLASLFSYYGARMATEKYLRRGFVSSVEELQEVRETVYWHQRGDTGMLETMTSDFFLDFQTSNNPQELEEFYKRHLSEPFVKTWLEAEGLKTLEDPFKRKLLNSMLPSSKEGDRGREALVYITSERALGIDLTVDAATIENLDGEIFVLPFHIAANVAIKYMRFGQFDWFLLPRSPEPAEMEIISTLYKTHGNLEDSFKAAEALV